MIVAQAPEHRKSFIVAVVGGGITGLVFAVALCRRGVPVQVYEAAPLFEEIGAGVGLGPNAVRALQLLSQEMYEIFIRYAIGNESVDKQRTMFDMRHGIGKPSLITSLSAAGIGAQNIHRAHFLDALAGLLPDGIVRFGKRLRSVDEEQGGKMILRFEDGSTAGADAVIGCDGIKSRVRHLVLSPDSPARDPQFSGKYVYRGIIPMARAIELLGEDLAMNSQGFLGPHGHVLTFPIAHGKLMNVVAFSTARDGEWVNEKWVVPVPAERVQSDFRSWGPPVQAIVKELGDQNRWGLYDHAPAENFSRGRIAMMGDAAHASTPHQGAGAGQGIEDAYIMASLLAHSSIKTDVDIPRAFKAFDAVRRPRSQRVVSTSREQGHLYDFELLGVEDDVEKIGALLRTRSTWIWDVDLGKHLADAVAIMDQASTKY